MDLRLAQPPLPSSKNGQGERDIEDGTDCLCGTEEWKVAVPEIWGGARPCWIEVDFAPEVGEETALLEGMDTSPREERGNRKAMWPEYRPWRVGLFIEEGRMNFRDMEVEGVAR